jgi:hypothetical protein
MRRGNTTSNRAFHAEVQRTAATHQQEGMLLSGAAPMRTAIPPELHELATTIAAPFRFLFAMPLMAAITLLRRPDESFEDAKARVTPAITSLCEARFFEQVAYIACTNKYLDLDDNERRIFTGEPLNMNECVRLSTDVFWRPFDASPPIFAPQAFLIPTEITHELIPSRALLPFNPTMIKARLKDAELENPQIVEHVERNMAQGHRKRASYDLRNARDRQLFQAYNHLMTSTQFAYHLSHERTKLWESNHFAPPHIGPHAEYTVKMQRVGVVYVGNLSPKALYFLGHHVLGHLHFDALDLIW